MIPPRVLRYLDAEELISGAAARLVNYLGEVQQHQEYAHLCLSGGPAVLGICRQLAMLSPTQAFDISRIQVWWSSDRFVAPTDPVRYSFQSLSLLASTMHLVPTQIHAMPSSTGHADPDDAAFAYAKELGDTVFDVCLLDVGEDGHIASIFPRHPSFAMQATTTLVATGVTDAPYDPPERVTLTIPTMNRSRQAWLVASGAQKQDAVARGVAGDVRSPAGQIHGAERTLWFVDQDAAGALPRFECDL